MKKKQFSVTIKAPREKVWEVLWNDQSYREWTSPFAEGSYAVSDWKEGNRIQFLSPSGEGMFSMIAKKIPNEFMSFKHLGVMKEGKEQPADAQTENWSGSMENYSLKNTNGSTELSVEIDVIEEFEKFFDEAFPKALAKVKELAEN
ncbi:MAG TPA: SRPBCC domain-containing protein [Bacteroidia bacterium]|nr:SRPBCC domain-containing protein [Bacteroidia bacterium]